jgi:hypothetical protein
VAGSEVRLAIAAHAALGAGPIKRLVQVLVP